MDDDEIERALAAFIENPHGVDALADMLIAAADHSHVVCCQCGVCLDTRRRIFAVLHRNVTPFPVAHPEGCRCDDCA